MIRMDYISNKTKHTNKLTSTKPKPIRGNKGFLSMGSKVT